MAEMNLGAVICKVNLKIKGISVDPETGAVLFSLFGNSGNKDTNSSGKLFGCIARISNNSELKKVEKRKAGLKLESDRFTLSVTPNQYFEIIYRFDANANSLDLSDPIKKIVCDEVYGYFQINQSNSHNLIKQKQMIDNSAYEAAGCGCVQDSYESAKILHTLSEGQSFTVEVEGHDTVQIHFPVEPPKPIPKVDNNSIELIGYRVKAIDFELNQIAVLTDTEKKKNIVLSPEEFNKFHQKYADGILSKSVIFNFVVKEQVGKKFNLISFCSFRNEQIELNNV
ncbi:hypothetical protein J9B83_13375 [Marinomonas sp. A79]|uniref:Uncharacterized protein n=1 Tax=Marinomonas vulgaris TaxID=2823372 RepID=A0ABS5HEU0_9GAMM|nr:hypothetical protein [Marinomonas vulgaris]MBR7889912.1 hypothetical protein [Marinomonas vulgaris]